VLGRRRIEKNIVARKVNTMKRDLQEDLDQRRGRLARMLAEEDAKYTAELESLEETPDSRRERLRARARELVRRREQEKREFTNQMLERQFREGCDAFREFDGQALLKECMVARDKALDERAEQRRRDNEEDALWHTRLLELVRKADEREQNDKNRSVDLRSAMLRTLQDQVRELKERKEEDERLKQEEARLMKERFELDLAEARAKERERAELFAKKKVAIAQHNAVLKAEKEAEIRRQQEEDLLLLNAMLEKERQAEEAELTYKAVLKKQAREYQVPQKSPSKSKRAHIIYKAVLNKQGSRVQWPGSRGQGLGSSGQGYRGQGLGSSGQGLGSSGQGPVARV